VTPPADLVIFDCDGVLVDSERLAVRVEAGLISDLGWPLTEADVLDRFVGRSDTCMLSEIEASSADRYPTGRTATSRTSTAPSAKNSPPSSASSLHSTSSPSRPGLHRAGQTRRCSSHWIFSTTAVAAGEPAPDLLLPQQHGPE